MPRKHKFNEKKLLHKVGKQWVTVSLAVFSLMIGGVMVSQTNVSADGGTPVHSVTQRNVNYNSHSLGSVGVKSDADKSMTRKSQSNSNVSHSASNNDQNNNNANNSSKASQVQHGKWDDVNVNYYPDDTMELAGNGTIKAEDAPKSLPFGKSYPYNRYKNDWKLKIADNSNVTLDGNSKGQQFAGSYYRNHINNETIWSQFKSMDLSKLNTSNVTDMNHMFAGDGNLQSLDVSHFDTSHVSNMSSMFDFDENLHVLDLSSFDTGNIPKYSNESNVGMNDMFFETPINKLYLGSKTNLNKANQNFNTLIYNGSIAMSSNGFINSVGNDATNEIENGNQPAGVYYLTSFKQLDIHLIDSDTNNEVSKMPDEYSRGIGIPILHDENYQNIITNQIKKLDPYLVIPDGYKEAPNDQQDYTVHNIQNSNRNFSPFINVKLTKDSNVHYQSDIKHDISLWKSDVSSLEYDLGLTDGDKSANSLINHYGDIANASDRYFNLNEELGRYENVPNSYTASEANAKLQVASSAVSMANSVASSANASDAQQSQSSDDNYKPKPKPHPHSQSSESSNTSSSTNTDSANAYYSDEINSLNSKVDAYSNEITQMNTNVQSLENLVSKSQSTSNDQNSNTPKRKAPNHKHVNRNKRSSRVVLPRTKSKYWKHNRHVLVKHGFRAYRIHYGSSKRKARVVRSKWIKANRKIYVSHRNVRNSWTLTGYGLHKRNHYYWIYKGDRIKPNHFKRLK